jgi:hypothetical protein
MTSDEVLLFSSDVIRKSDKHIVLISIQVIDKNDE